MSNLLLEVFENFSKECTLVAEISKDGIEYLFLFSKSCLS